MFLAKGIQSKYIPPFSSFSIFYIQVSFWPLLILVDRKIRTKDETSFLVNFQTLLLFLANSVLTREQIQKDKDRDIHFF